MEAFFQLDMEGGVAHLQLNRPERLNAMAPSFFPALHDAVRQLQDEGRARVLLISSTGPHFSAGMALDEFAAPPRVRPEPPRDRRDPHGEETRNAIGALMDMLDTSAPRTQHGWQESLRQATECFTAIDEARFPVVCAIQGGCIGGALDLASACDIRLCSADAFFTVQQLHSGAAAHVGVLQRLARVVPQGLARQMAYTGERLDAQRALAVGLVNAVLPDAAALLAHAQALAHTIAGQSPLAVAHCKQVLNQARDHGAAAALHQADLLQDGPAGPLLPVPRLQ